MCLPGLTLILVFPSQGPAEKNKGLLNSGMSRFLSQQSMKCRQYLLSLMIKVMTNFVVIAFFVKISRAVFKGNLKDKAPLSNNCNGMAVMQ